VNKKVLLIFVIFSFLFSFLLIQCNSFSQAPKSTDDTTDQTSGDTLEGKIVDIKVLGNKSISSATILNKINNFISI